MNTKNIAKYIAIVLCVILAGCEDFVSIEAPNNKMVRADIFEDETAAESAMQGIYNQLFVLAFSNGFENSVTNLTALSADNLRLIRESNPTYLEFQENEILPDNSRNLSLWSSAYNLIYLTNSLLEGLEESSLDENFKQAVEGQALFIRAFTYFNLVNLYGDVPLLLTTDYTYNAQAPRISATEVYDQIIRDLEDAASLLSEEYVQNQRTYVNQNVVYALMARVYLYLENWEMALDYSNRVISKTSSYELLSDLNEVFLMNNREAIWQISPLGNGEVTTQTYEGALYIIEPGASASYNLALTQDLIDTFAENDSRLIKWIDFSEVESVYFAHKYKDRYSTGNVTEYSMVLRLAEQYLIRAEARAMKNKINLAIDDINKIRTRAGIEALDKNSSWNMETLQSLILEERRRELFTEWGHRWFDLKRMNKTTEVLSPKKTSWQSTDSYYPIPAEERRINSNLTQNEGY
ncbi:RagB/SusD family nutrient uptake outer membrane protein [Zunongwangia sp. HGR-M22]|uniref:RagB/SusD family nutrient uptake outer membrane protein n=1 Tax=Zunongwangia sp. HGR-M22 TaxID=3015168 RepID=UPI0022DDBB34|nr:RagB/SusD family nutrient uptake outer membrane protein [Zunongwangia sp. HGR-M22]WBL26699.1 RagB/SusD family nutrient uptake outer membrane protein [Zunongwangia sp. HGR-M22]